MSTGGATGNSTRGPRYPMCSGMPPVASGLSVAHGLRRSQKSEGTRMKIVLMGCGRVGARLARLFEREGHEVSVIDLHTESFVRLGPNFRGQTVAGTGIDE